MTTEKKNYALPIAIMFLLFFMIAFVTNFAGSMGVIVKTQFGASNAMSQLGTLANFIAYACMGIPAGIILKRKGYKFTSLAAVTVGLVGVAIQWLSGPLESFAVYVLGAFVAGFSMCMLNIVVNPMLNTLGGGGDKGNQLLQLGGSCNSLGGTIAPILLGWLIGGSTANATVRDAAPAMIIAMIIFALAFIIFFFTDIPEPHMETPEEKAARLSGKAEKDPYGPMSFRHFVLGALAIFFYVGVEVGIPNTANLYMSDLPSVGPAIAGTLIGIYWFLMMIGRMIGGAIGGGVCPVLANNLSVSATQGKTDIVVTWNDVAGREGYALYRKGADGEIHRIAGATIYVRDGTVTYHDVAVVGGQAYTYYVKPFNMAFTGRAVSATATYIVSDELSEYVSQYWNPATSAGLQNGPYSKDGSISPSKLAEDVDGDGFSTYDEYVAGTNPLNPLDRFRSNINVQGDTCTITWAPDLGDKRKYTVQGTDVLGGEWRTQDPSCRFFKVDVELK